MIARRESRAKGNDSLIVWYDWQWVGVHDEWTGVIAFAYQA